jgi:hypothetical protein
MEKTKRLDKKWVLLYTIGLILVVTFESILIILLSRDNNPYQGEIIISMSLFLFLVWNGFILFVVNKIDTFKRIKDHVGLYFVVWTLAFALIEEAIAVTATNMFSYLFSVSPYDYFITASPLYFEVISKHSVIVFLPLIIVWGIVLEYKRFSVYAIYILFGLNGLIGEWIAFGNINWIAIVYWIIVYGNMVLIPSMLLDSKSKNAGVLMHIIMIVLPLIISILVIILRIIVLGGI